MFLAICAECAFNNEVSTRKWEVSLFWMCAFDQSRTDLMVGPMGQLFVLALLPVLAVL